jgi:hypothetical protein
MCAEPGSERNFVVEVVIEAAATAGEPAATA